MQRGRRIQADNERATRVVAKANGARARAGAAADAERAASPRAGRAANKAAGRTAQPDAAKATPENKAGAPVRSPKPEVNGRAARGGRRDAAGAAPVRAPLPERSPPPRPLISAAAAPPPPPQAPELDWDDIPCSAACDALALRWAARGQELFQSLVEHGAAQHEVRVDLKEGLFVWVDGAGRVSAEARAQVLCSWSRATSVVSMAWADPLVRGAAVPRIDGMLSERDDVDEDGAWQIAMEAAEASGASFLYRVSAPHAWYFLGLSSLSFTPARESFHPGPPVGLVLRALSEVRAAIESRAEPRDVIRERLCSLGSALFHQAEYTYRGTDWVARLDRTGKLLLQLAKRLPRPTFSAIAAGQQVDDWIDRDLALELLEHVELLEDEWAPFC